jgi:MtN3 and saliva related transmembrane protein
MKEIVAVIFGLGLLVNAGLFAAQSLKIWQTKNAEGVSVITFAGFCGLQITGILHGWFQGDMYLLGGMVASLICCGSVVVLALMYGKK